MVLEHHVGQGCAGGGMGWGVHGLLTTWLNPRYRRRELCSYDDAPDYELRSVVIRRQPQTVKRGLSSPPPLVRHVYHTPSLVAQCNSSPQSLPHSVEAAETKKGGGSNPIRAQLNACLARFLVLLFDLLSPAVTFHSLASETYHKLFPEIISLTRHIPTSWGGWVI